MLKSLSKLTTNIKNFIISNIYNPIKLFIEEKYSNKKINLHKYKIKQIKLDDTTYIYKLIYTDTQKILDKQELEFEISNLKRIINFDNDFIRINCEMLCYFESINSLRHCQTKTYTIFIDDYAQKTNKMLTDLILISEKYDIMYISEISFIIKTYNKKIKLNEKDYLKIKKEFNI